MDSYDDMEGATQNTPDTSLSGSYLLKDYQEQGSTEDIFQETERFDSMLEQAGDISSDLLEKMTSIASESRTPESPTQEEISSGDPIQNETLTCVAQSSKGHQDPLSLFTFSLDTDEVMEGAMTSTPNQMKPEAADLETDFDEICLDDVSWQPRDPETLVQTPSLPEIYHEPRSFGIGLRRFYQTTKGKVHKHLRDFVSSVSRQKDAITSKMRQARNPLKRQFRVQEMHQETDPELSRKAIPPDKADLITLMAKQKILERQTDTNDPEKRPVQSEHQTSDVSVNTKSQASENSVKQDMSHELVQLKRAPDQLSEFIGAQPLLKLLTLVPERVVWIPQVMTAIWMIKQY